MILYDFKKLSLKLDFLNFPEVRESRFEIVRKDLSEEENRGNVTFKEDGIYLMINGIEHKGYMYIKKAAHRCSFQKNQFLIITLKRSHDV